MRNDKIMKIVFHTFLDPKTNLKDVKLCIGLSQVTSLRNDCYR